MGSLQDVPKNWLEQVQRGAARFATKIYSRQEGCVTQALNHLNWPTMKHKRCQYESRPIPSTTLYSLNAENSPIQTGI